MFLCLFVALAFIAVSSFFVTTAFAEVLPIIDSPSDFDPSSVEDKCAQLSEIDLLEGGLDENGNEQTLENYMDRMNNKPYSYDVHADLIYRIIPVELFENDCEYFHRGIEYSFYIHTKTDPWNGKKCFDVFIIDNRFNVNTVSNTAGIRLQTYAASYITDLHPDPQYGLVTQCFANTTELEYSLHNVKFYASLTNEHALNKCDINYAMLTVCGGNAELNGCVMTAGDGIVVDELSVENSVLKAYGGYGTHPLKYQGYVGAKGGNGITTSSINVTNSSVYFYGGDGGNGDRGAAGTKGSNGANGTAGQTGGQGGAGGLAVNMVKKDGFTMFAKDGASTVLFTGGEGGDGGLGGIGGAGGDGVSTVNGGKGGNGGRGGNGGNYGQGGKACKYSFDGVQSVDGCTGIGGMGNYGGGNGIGSGNGGNGGDGGDSYFVMYKASGGKAGVGGSKGSNGNVGKMGNCIPNGVIFNYYFGTSTIYKYTLYAYSPSTVTIYTTGSNAGDPYLELYDQYGNLLASDDNGNGGQNAKISHFIASGTKYTIVVKSLSVATVQLSLYVK